MCTYRGAYFYTNDRKWRLVTENDWKALTNGSLNDNIIPEQVKNSQIHSNGRDKMLSEEKDKKIIIFKNKNDIRKFLKTLWTKEL